MYYWARKRSLKGLLGLVLLMGTSLPAFALDITPNGLYRATKEACSQINESDLSNLNFDKLNAGQYPSREFTEIHTFIRSESLRASLSQMNVHTDAQVTTYILSNAEFKKALSECYPHSLRMQKFFLESIRRSDRAGKAVGVSLMVAVFKGTGRLFSLVQSWSQTAYRSLQLANYGMDALLLSSLLKQDTHQEKKLSLSDVIPLNEVQDEQAKYAQMEESLRRQIQNEENKISQCQNCPEKAQLEANRLALQNLLSSLAQK